MNPIDDNKIEMIYQFLDSELPEETQDKLFSELAYNKALRKEIVYAYNSKNSLILEYAETSIPTALNAKVLSLVDVSKSVSFINNFLNVKFLTNMLISSVIGAVISFVIFSNMNPHTLYNGINATSKNLSPTQNSINQIPVSKNLLNAQEPISKNKKILKNEKKENNSFSEKNVNTNNYVKIQYSPISKSKIQNFHYEKINDIQAINTMEFMNHNNLISNSDLWKKFEDFYIEVNSLNTLKLFPYRDLNFVSNNALSNLSLTIKYRITDNQFLGLEYGNETFPLFIENNLNIFDPKNHISWLGAVYQYDFNELINSISPTCKFFAGGNESGPIFKADIGLLWKADSKVRFYLTLSGTELVYRYKGNWFNTQKLGLKYGAEINL